MSYFDWLLFKLCPTKYVHINCKTYTIVTLANTHDFFKFGIHTKHDTKLDKWIS